jgi:hypothetical protein
VHKSVVNHLLDIPRLLGSYVILACVSAASLFIVVVLYRFLYESGLRSLADITGFLTSNEVWKAVAFCLFICSAAPLVHAWVRWLISAVRRVLGFTGFGMWARDQDQAGYLVRFAATEAHAIIGPDPAIAVLALIGLDVVASLEQQERSWLKEAICGSDCPFNLWQLYCIVLATVLIYRHRASTKHDGTR